MTEPKCSDNPFPVAARNTSDVQVDILLEAHRSILLRLTALENNLEGLADTIELHAQAVQKSFRVLQAELDELRQAVFSVPTPRRCVHCARVVPAFTSECEVCKKAP